MIYDLITKFINNYLGDGDYVLDYANNHDFKWEKVLPEAQNELKYGVLRVDSGTTQQIGGRTIRTEQLRLIVAIPEQNEIFKPAVANLRSMLDGLNNTTVEDDEDNITALLLFGEYHDASCQTINGNKWWVSEVTFIANFYDGVYDSNDTKVEIEIPLTIDNVTTNTYLELGGIISTNYTMQKTYDPNVYNGNPNNIPSVNSKSKSLQITLIYLKNNALVNYLVEHEEDLDLALPTKYTNGVKTRTMTCDISSVTENVVTGDILKATITLVNIS